MADESRQAGGFEDRTVGLVFFGVIQLLGGLLSLAMLAFVVFSMLIASARPAGAPELAVAPIEPGMVAVVALEYSAIAALLFTLGVGSILCRRWARTLSLLLGWLALAGGSFATLAVVLLLPSMTAMLDQVTRSAAEAAPELGGLVFWLALLATAFFGILVPGAFVLFYRSPHVRATCERKDPVPRWTDRRPLPILALTLMLAWGMLAPLALVMTGGTLVLGEAVLHGAGALLAVLAIAALSGWCARAVWQLDIRGWWAGLLFWLGLGTFSVLSFRPELLRESYEQMGMPAEQIEMSLAMLSSPGRLLFLQALALLAVLALFLYTKRFFAPSAT